MGSLTPDSDSGTSSAAVSSQQHNMVEGLNPRLALAIAAGAIGSSFQHGYNTGVLNAPEGIMTEWLKSQIGCGNGTEMDAEKQQDCITNATLIWSWIVAIFCVGGTMGGSLVGIISSKCGRKGGLLLNNILVVIATLLMGLAKTANSYHMLIAGRLVIGLNSGLAPMYLAEISPTSLRGALGTVYQLIITLSILLDKDDEHGAEEALQWLRGTIEVHDEMDEMKQEQESMKLVPKVTLKEMLVNSSLRKPLIIAMMMMLAQQLSGINCAIFYSTNIFKEAGLNPTQSQSATLGMGAMNVAMTFVSLALIEKAGRKVLMLSGLSLMICMTILLLASLLTFTTVPAMSYVAVVAVITFVVGFATGPGSIPWFFVTELFAQSGRPTATSIAVVVNWTANFLVGLGFQPMQLLMGPWVFMVFIVIQLFFIVYVAVVVPETKGKTIDEITARFRK